MPRNVEIKARLRDRSSVERLVRSLADHGPELIHQEDVFFNCGTGRLKLRVFDERRGELIFYRRPDAKEPTESEFVTADTTEPRAMIGALEAALGTAGVVRKRRTLYLIGQTRVHLDEVEGLGDWLELEVVLRSDQLPDEGAWIAEALMAELGLQRSDLEARAYVDLLNSKFIIENT